MGGQHLLENVDHNFDQDVTTYDKIAITSHSDTHHEALRSKGIAGQFPIKRLSKRTLSFESVQAVRCRNRVTR